MEMGKHQVLRKKAKERAHQPSQVMECISWSRIGDIAGEFCKEEWWHILY